MYALKKTLTTPIIADYCEAKSLSQFLAELALVDGQGVMMHFRQSTVGAACVALARHNVGMAAWGPMMTARTGIRIEDFQKSLIHLNNLFNEAPGSFAKVSILSTFFSVTKYTG
jgi:Cyclin, C-terminal domain